MNIKQYGEQGVIALVVLGGLAIFGGVRPAQAIPVTVTIDFNAHINTPTTNGTPPSGAVVTDDYESSGIVFGRAGESTGVAVVTNTGLGSTNVACGLDASGNIPNCSGDIYFNFVDPTGSDTKVTTDSLSFKLGGARTGFFDKSWELYVYDIDDNLLEKRDVTDKSPTTQQFNLAGIHRVYIENKTGILPNYALDDITFIIDIPDTPPTPAPVPEPSTMLLLGSGLVGLLGYGWRNRHQTM